MNRFTLQLIALVALHFASAEKTCRQAYDRIECLNNGKGYIICDFDIENDTYNRTVVYCPKNTKCVCWVGDKCTEQEMCGVQMEPKPFIDAGMMTWAMHGEYDCSGCEEVTDKMEKGFVYKLPNGRYFRQVLDSGNNYERTTTKVLVVPRTDGPGFIKYTSTNNVCSKSVVSSSDPLVQLNLIGYRLQSLPLATKQTWRKEENRWDKWGGAEETEWTFTGKESEGKLIPISTKYLALTCEFEKRETRYTYYPSLDKKHFKKIREREEELLKSCQ